MEIWPLDYHSTVTHLAVSLRVSGDYISIVIGFPCPSCGLVLIPIKGRSSQSICGCVEDCSSARPLVGQDNYSYEIIASSHRRRGKFPPFEVRYGVATRWVQGYLEANHA